MTTHRDDDRNIGCVLPSVTLNRIKFCCFSIRRKEWHLHSKARRIYFGVQMVHEREKASSLCQTSADGAILHAKNAEVCFFCCKMRLSAAIEVAMLLLPGSWL